MIVTQPDVGKQLSRWWEPDTGTWTTKFPWQQTFTDKLRRNHWGFKFSRDFQRDFQQAWPAALIEGHEQKGQNKGGEQRSCAGLPKVVDWI